MFDSNTITPGTPFMGRLSAALQYYVHLRLNHSEPWKDLLVLLSDSNVPGEGEHKVWARNWAVWLYSGGQSGNGCGVVRWVQLVATTVQHAMWLCAWPACPVLSPLLHRGLECQDAGCSFWRAGPFVPCAHQAAHTGGATLAWTWDTVQGCAVLQARPLRPLQGLACVVPCSRSIATHPPISPPADHLQAMQYIREQRGRANWNPNTRHVMYGLDADLIMLGLATHEPHFFILRELVTLPMKKDARQDLIAQAQQLADEAAQAAQPVSKKPYQFLKVGRRASAVRLDLCAGTTR